MFSRLFSSKPKPSTEQPVAAGRSLSPSTESASVSASAATAAPGSPTRVALPPSRTPSPDPGPAALHSLISTCPPKTLYAYTLPRLELATATELQALSTFFGALEPPSRLHCVRCHKGYFEVENDDRSCTMPHDDESAEVEHVGYSRSKAAGAYETRWECCGKTVEGDGDLGPPSGWCYEGKHTMDRKRARYRNDSTPANDLLESCEARGCHRKQHARTRTRVPIADDARSTRSARSAESEHARDSPGKAKPQRRPTRKRSQMTAQQEVGSPVPGGQNDDPAPKKKKRKVT